MKKSAVRALASGDAVFKRFRQLSLRRLHSGIGAARSGVLRDLQLSLTGARRASASRASAGSLFPSAPAPTYNSPKAQSNTLLLKFRSLMLGPSGVQVALWFPSSSGLTLPSSGPAFGGPLKSNVRRRHPIDLDSMQQTPNLILDRCPHCTTAHPNLSRAWGPAESKNHADMHRTFWSIYRCASCGGMVMVCSPQDHNQPVSQIWPKPTEVSEELPPRAKEFLGQAMASLHAPAGAVMLTASAVDAMLKAKNYREGSLYTRIDKAKSDGLITAEMAAWAHEIRLDANDNRHADEGAALPDTEAAKKAIDFASALAQFMFILPARVERGRKGDA